MLAEKLYKLESFRRQYEAVLRISVSETIPKLKWNIDKKLLLSEIDWNNILGIASVLSYSDVNIYLDAALRIAQTCITEETSTEIQKNAATIILQNLTNKPAIKLAIERNQINKNYRDDYPISFKLQTLNSEFENSISLDDKFIYLNKFQKEVHDVYENNETFSISAPTSAGKSFILCTIILEELIKKKQNIVYIVPTRALISQVEFDLRKLLLDHTIKNVNVSTVPQNDIDKINSNIFVFTQERLHWFLIENNLQIDLMIIDEAHKIEDGNRGILLQQKIEEVVKYNPKIKVYFSSPFTSNPEILLDNVKNKSRKEKVNTQFVSVNQNLIYLTQVPRKPTAYMLHLCLIDHTIYLGNVELYDRPGTSDFRKLIFLTKELSDCQPGNIIYSNGAADTEDKAQILYDLIDDHGAKKSNKIIELVKLVKKTIHSEYVLAKVLNKRIAFHYGNMPLLIRQEIEKLFKEGEIKYLICTSTLLEGINLPAKSIFIRKPTRGNRKPLDQNDFWNLAGRAGRWGIEYSGNIFCLDPTNWPIQPNPNRSKQLIRRAVDIIENNGSELINYIEEKSPRAEANSRQDLEFAFGYYYIQFLNNELDVSDNFKAQLNDIFIRLKPTIVIPDGIIKRNPGISPIAQQELYNYFLDNLDRIEELIPVYPEDIKAVEEYTKLVGRIGKTLADYPNALHYSKAILLVNWMSGKPLSYLISTSYKYYQKKEKKEKTLPVVIREVMDNVESFVRFRFAKDSGCYIDILRYFLQVNKKHELHKNIPELNLWLEFGVSNTTHLSLLSLGLTRNSVIELAEFITNTNMSRDQCLKWLLQQNFEQMNLSPIIISDISNSLTTNSFT